MIWSPDTPGMCLLNLEDCEEIVTSGMGPGLIPETGMDYQGLEEAKVNENRL